MRNMINSNMPINGNLPNEAALAPGPALVPPPGGAIGPGIQPGAIGPNMHPMPVAPGPAMSGAPAAIQAPLRNPSGVNAGELGRPWAATFNRGAGHRGF